MLLRVLLVCAASHWAGHAHAQACAQVYDAIRAEAMYCGFFCDQAKLRPLQKTYEESCIRVVVPVSLFDLDSRSDDTIPLAASNDLTVGAALPRDGGLPRH
jgi:hypothetical protein